MEPLLILVAMFSVWKNDVWDGSMPVGPAGMFTVSGAITPARAGAPTLNSLIFLRTSTRLFCGDDRARGCQAGCARTIAALQPHARDRCSSNTEAGGGVPR
jgi:hypothetical protein